MPLEDLFPNHFPLGDAFQHRLCRIGMGHATCEHHRLVEGRGACTKGIAPDSPDWRALAGEGKHSDSAAGNNCSGPPDFTPIGTSAWVDDGRNVVDTR